MAVEAPPNLEDLARRYDARVLREYLLNQQEGGSSTGGNAGHSLPSSSNLVLIDVAGPGGDENAEQPHPLIPVVHDLRPRCFRRLRALLALNFVGFWTACAQCGYSYYLKVQEQGPSVAPPLEVCLLCIFTLGTQATLELAASALLMRPARASDARSNGFRSWDAVAWKVGSGARSAIMLDVLCLAPLWRGQGSSMLFFVSASVLVFAIGIFVFGVQLRMLLGLFWSADQFSFDKPDLFFKGADARGIVEGRPIAAQPPANMEDDDMLDPMRADRLPPLSVIKVANFCQLSDLALLHEVLVRLYIPVSCQETQEFVASMTSMSRCFCQDVVQCSVKFLYLMDCEAQPLVLLSLLISMSQALATCFFTSTGSMEVGPQED